MTIFTLSRSNIAHGCLSEYETFAELVESLTDVEWNTPSRCAGWQVRDVAGHVIGLAEDVAAGVPGSRTGEEEAASVRHEPPSGAAARLRIAIEGIRAFLDLLDDAAWAGPSPVPDLPLGDGVLLLWFDTYVHGDDIRAATGRSGTSGPGLDASVAYLARELTKRGYRPATLALAGASRHDISSGGAAITGDALQFVLVATGRADPATIGLDPDISIY